MLVAGLTVDRGDHVADLHPALAAGPPGTAGDEQAPGTSPPAPPRTAGSPRFQPEVGVGDGAGFDDLIGDRIAEVDRDGEAQADAAAADARDGGTVAPAVGTPTSWSSQFTSAPPLLPGLIAASVCTAPTSSAWPPLSPGTWTVRSSALTMPDVTVPERPSGAPSATTGWPTWTVSDEPIAITSRSCGGFTWSTARSV